jgi:pyridoxamine 5'-phosphate oxidase
MELKDYRRQYTKGGLRETSMPDDPLVLFEQWQKDATAAGLADPTGVVVATVQPDGSIRQRFVLLKGVSEDGFVFFTNYNSDKAAALARNPRSSMLFPWNELDRQVSVSGKVEKIAESESDAYFAARRGALEAQYQATLERFDGGDVPRPPHWGGFKLVPERIEFWQGGEDRLHDRFVYQYTNDWNRSRLQP